MKVEIALALVAGMVALGGAWQTAPETRSVWDGVYTQEQAERGGAVYGGECASCHGEDLMGRDEATPLTGGQFMSNWDGLTVGDLFERVRVSMPQGEPGKLSGQQTADVLAYVLNVNGFPPGEAELARHAQLLKEIRIEARKPGSE
jgi:mono/diheme cytochrome c family protein